MLKLKSPYLFIFIFFFSLVYSQEIYHKIIDQVEANKNITIDVLISEEYSKINSVKLYYKSNNQFNFLEQKMAYKGSGFFYSVIPDNYVINDLQYYIVLELKNKKLYSFPYDSPKTKPLQIKVKKQNNKNKKVKLDLEKQGVQVLSPAPNSRVFKDDLLISLSYFKLKNINKDKIRVLLNNRDITNKVTFYDNYFIYKPDFILDGKYNVEVIFIDKYDRELPKFSWSFLLISRDKLDGLSTMFSHSGRFSNNYSLNSINSEILEVNDFNADYRVNFDFLKVRNKFKISSLSSEFEQDRNRYLVDFKAPYINLQLGDSYPYMSQFALNSYRIRGLNLKIDSKFIDFHIIQGELARAVEGDPIQDALVISDINSVMICVDEGGNQLVDIDSQEDCCEDECGDGLNQWITSDNYIIDFSRDNYTFKRNIYGFNLGIGNPEKLFYNFNIIKSKDNINTLSSISDNMGQDYLIEIPDNLFESINSNYISSITIDTAYTDNGDDIDTTITYYTSYDNLMDSLNYWFGTEYSKNLLSKNWVGEKPKDNLVMGSNIKVALDNQKIIFNFGSSLSLLNQDIWQPTLSIDAIDTLFDSNQDGMIMEDISLPSDFDFSEYEDIFQFSLNQTPILPIDLVSDRPLLEKIMTMPSLAYNIDLLFNYFDHNINMGIKQIGPEYYSLANPYLQTDIREQYINDKFRLLNKRLFVNYGFKRIEDGIEVDKKSLSKTDKYNLSLNYYPGYDLPTYGLSIKLIGRDNGIDSLDVFTYQEYVGIGEEGADELGYMEVSDTTNRRENTRSIQSNFNISYNYQYYGSHNFLFNISQMDKEDLLFKENFSYDSLGYFSPRTFNQTMILNAKSTWSTEWSTNVNFSYNYYNYGNNDYFQEQNLKQFNLTGYYYRLKKINTIQLGLNYSKAEGFLEYYQIGSTLNSKIELIKNIFINFSYEYRYRKTGNELQKNKYFFIKASYNF